MNFRRLARILPKKSKLNLQVKVSPAVIIYTQYLSILKNVSAVSSQGIHGDKKKVELNVLASTSTNTALKLDILKYTPHCPPGKVQNGSFES